MNKTAKTWSWGLVVLVLASLVFGKVLFGGGVLLTTDDNIGAVATVERLLPSGYSAAWLDSPLLGHGAIRIPLGFTNLFYILLPVTAYMNLMHLICLLLASLFLFLFLKRQGVHPAACVFAAVVAYWLGSNLTLVYAGHTRKFGILALSAAALFTLTYIRGKRPLAISGVFGALAGMMFCEQQDVALFFALPLGAYFLLQLISARMGWITRVGSAATAAVLALMIASPALLSGYKTSVEDVAAVQESNQGKWDFATQWSWPPEESIAFIAPGYTGWRSGEPAGPYWGRMGRSPGWEQTRQGFMNFKLENTYLGVIPILLALFSLMWLKAPRVSVPDDASVDSPDGKREVIFWASMSVLTLLLAFGKYFPLYRLFFQLPVVNNIRNPNKFLQVFQVSLAILAAWGLQGTFVQSRLYTKRMLLFLIVGVAGLALIVFFWLIASMGGSDVSALIRFGWPQQAAKMISANKTTAVAHLLVIMLLFLAILFILRKFGQITHWRLWLAGSLVVVVALDGAWLSRHYIKTMPKSWIENHAVTAELKKTLGENRVATLSQDGFYNLWLTYLFPYQGVRAFNFTQMPRMPEAYKMLLGAFQRNPLRLWQLSGVGAVLMPLEAFSQITSQPAGRQLLEKRLAFDVQGSADNQVRTVVSPNGRQVLASFAPDQSGRYRLVGGTKRFQTASDALKWLADSRHPLFEKVAIHDANAPDIEGSGNAGSVRVRQLSPALIELDIDAQKQSVLRCADRFNSDWKATIDGQEVPVFQADFCMMGVAVPQGKHTVQLSYRPSSTLLYVQIFGYLLALVLLVLIASARLCSISCLRD